jgi:hypothetical protein
MPMSPQQDKQLNALRIRLEEVERELERIAEMGGTQSSEATAGSETDDSEVGTESTAGSSVSRFIPILSLSRGSGAPIIRAEQEIGLKGKIAQKAGEVIAEKAAEEIANKMSQGPTVASDGSVTYPCGYSSEVFVNGSGSLTTTFWWNATDGEISDYAPTADEQTKRQADDGLKAKLAALITAGCEAPCKPTVQVIGNITYTYGSSRTKIGNVSTDVTYTCQAQQKVKLTCTQP